MSIPELEAAIKAIGSILNLHDRGKLTEHPPSALDRVALYGAKDALEIELLAMRRLDAKRYR